MSKQINPFSQLIEDPTGKDLMYIQEQLQNLTTQVDCPVTHHFAKGQCVRELFMAEGLVVLGHKHKESTINILLSGSILLYNGVGKEPTRLDAPYVYTSEAGTQKLIYILKDATWLNCFPSSEKDPDRILEAFIEPPMEIKKCQ